MKTHPLYISYSVCGATPSNHCRDLVTNAPTVEFHDARVAAAQE